MLNYIYAVKYYGNYFDGVIFYTIFASSIRLKAARIEAKSSHKLF